ncbi:MAG: hypothetical protein A2622_03655 [Bdellovibrionales bacterium RIFCSPHIGHO2_01_FULL_40_29]|nr:MAG: hypothetical protein A2622_03655 [Bdellovibrionales bacterium RIFCSPHIGHO2_01_FULL_40_29]OFZ35385.1 MAG: hypothetical protein A3D17_08375 [Bdellovibrionales bacterium RIFCSPHIGHO2_02_FULL_40_15]
MNLNLLKLSTALAVAATSTPKLAQAWGGRGHDSICEAAVFLVKNPNLKEYLQNKPHIMGHLCNVPDVHWKSLSDDSRKFGDPTHFIDAEILGLKITQIPTDYQKIVDTYTGSENKFQDGSKIFSVPKELGSVWWRADQFYRRAIEEGKKAKSSPTPTGSKEEQNETLPYNQAVYQMTVNMGLMGHFVGDASQPFHNTTDYDGYAANHGGIHAYYEDTAVSYFDSDLVSQITKRAHKMKSPSFLKPKSVIEKMRLFSELSANDIKSVLKADPIIKPSQLKIEKGMSLKTPAERQPGSVGNKRFQKLIIDQMARSSLMLAHLWDSAYEEAGQPVAKAYKSYRYPLTPEFVMPDYFDTPVEIIKKK